VNGLLPVATIAVPLYTAILHGGLYAYRRRERAHIWLALSALSVSLIAISVTARAHNDDPARALQLQQLSMLAGAFLLVVFPRWCHSYIGVARPRVEWMAVALAVVVVASNLAGTVFSSDYAMLPMLDAHVPTPAARLSRWGMVLVAGFGMIALDVGIQLARSARRRPETRAAFIAYCAFGLSVAYDIGVGAEVLIGPQLLPVGYLVMLAGLSSGLVQSFVSSMKQAEQYASDLSASVEERSEELRRKERQLVHGERLAALGTLAAGVAHEINDPLAFVSSNLNRIEEIWSDPAERRDVPEILDECHEGLARLRGTVEELLRLARRRESEPVRVDLAELVASVLPLVRAEGRFRARWTELLNAVPPVRGDPGLLAQVALQLLLNALRSVPEGAPGEHRIHVSTSSEGGRACLRVRDSGPPIAEADLPRLFDPFGPLATEADAPRLGLAVTHQIVTSHGGDIEIESGRGGTEVTVWLPVDAERRR
jgi:signal transduction histidine kinase